MIEKLNEIKSRHDEICKAMSDETVIADYVEYQKLAREEKKLAPTVDAFLRYKRNAENLESAKKLLATEKNNEMVELVQLEIAECEENHEKLQEELRTLLIPKDERDDGNVIMEIRPAAGGDEAALFAAALLRMYTMYAQANNFKIEVNDLDETEIGGLKSASIMIIGDGAFSQLKFESGVHRVQRVPDTETQGRIHTSTATVAVLPEAVTVDFKIEDKDIKVDVYRASGAGGQHVNKTESAIRITHLPTNTVVTCQDGRSQIKNREKAMTILQSKLAEYYQNLEDEKYAQTRKSQVGAGDRSEKIRTYNFPQSRVTDHRIGKSIHNLTAFMNGEISEMIDALRIEANKVTD
ncbi:MAG: peptide chain release factor 1 [Firmicutes bacterium]|nr:peptide chain release factor 1 [Bacillota bacterium]